MIILVNGGGLAGEEKEGRPRLRWMGSIKDYLREYGCSEAIGPKDRPYMKMGKYADDEEMKTAPFTLEKSCNYIYPTPTPHKMGKYADDKENGSRKQPHSPRKKAVTYPVL